MTKEITLEQKSKWWDKLVMIAIAIEDEFGGPANYPPTVKEQLLTVNQMWGKQTPDKGWQTIDTLKNFKAMEKRLNEILESIKKNKK